MTTDSSYFSGRRIWLAGILIATCVGGPLSLFANKAPWLIFIPMFLGTVIVCYLEIISELKSEGAQLPLVKVPRTFLGLHKYKGHVALWSPVEKEAEDQWSFAFLDVPKRRLPKVPRMIIDPETGEQIYLIDTERFVSLLIDHVLPGTEQVSEFALLQALHRYGEMESISGELERFLRSKTVLEVLKSHIRGNMQQTINNSSEAVIREAVRHVKETRQKAKVGKAAIAM